MPDSHGILLPCYSAGHNGICGFSLHQTAHGIFAPAPIVQKSLGANTTCRSDSSQNDHNMCPLPSRFHRAYLIHCQTRDCGICFNLLLLKIEHLAIFVPYWIIRAQRQITRHNDFRCLALLQTFYRMIQIAGRINLNTIIYPQNG